MFRGNDGSHTPGSDFVWAPPKSVSVEMIYASPERRAEIEGWIWESNQIMCDILQSEARVARVTVAKGEREYQTADLIISQHMHYTSRPTLETVEQGRPPDVGIHIHNFIANMARVGDKWYSVDHRKLMHKQRLARYAAEQYLSHKFEQGGYPVDYSDEDRRGNRTWELGNTDHRIRDLFSSRNRQVEKLLREFEKEHGRGPTWTEQQTKAREGRIGKEHEKEPTWEDYVAAVMNAGLVYESPRGYSPVQKQGTLEERTAKAYEHLMSDKGLLKNGATFRRYHLEPACYNAALEFLTPTETEVWIAQVLASDELIVVEAGEKDPDYDRVTTKSNLEREYGAETYGISLGFETCRAPTRQVMWDAIREEQNAQGYEYDNEQLELIKHFCEGRRLRMATGWAGSGKTSCLRAVKRAYKTLGNDARPYAPKTFAVAVAGSTANMLAGSLGCDGAYTIEGLEAVLVEQAKREAKDTKQRDLIPKGSLVFLDEALMVDTVRFHRLMRIADERDLILRSTGDALQLEAIGPGGIHRQLWDALGGIELTHVFRQANWRERVALQALRAGKAAQALRMLDRIGHLHRSDTFEEAAGALLEHYATLRAGSKFSPPCKPQEIIVNTDAPNVEIDRLNRIIQNQRIEAGELGNDSITVRSSLDKRTEKFHRGDLIAFTEGYEDEPHGVRIPNGTRGEVTRVAEWGVVVRTAKGESVSVYLTKLKETQPIRLAYAGHATRTQGAEAKICLVLPWLATTDRGSAYSMATRGREEVHVFAVAPQPQTKPEPPLKVGDTVRVGDRNNFGHVTSIAGDRVTVHFVSPEGQEATKDFERELVTKAREGEPPKATLGLLAEKWAIFNPKRTADSEIAEWEAYDQGIEMEGVDEKDVATWRRAERRKERGLVA